MAELLLSEEDEWVVELVQIPSVVKKVVAKADTQTRLEGISMEELVQALPPEKLAELKAKIHNPAVDDNLTS